MSVERPYGEFLRPQFHFTARENWLNDPNGLVFHDGEYHLFFQHNPQGNEWGNMTWGHAVSPDLVHWQQLNDAIHPYDGGTIFSGSAVMDYENTAGFNDGDTPAMIALFTHAREPFGQALAYSTDRGRTMTLFENGWQIIPNQGFDPGERDPRIFWHEETKRWILVLWVKHGMVRFFHSTDLKAWVFASDFEAPGFYECPDLIELAVNGNMDERRWVLYDAAFSYWIGSFDGEKFSGFEDPLTGDYGANFYAAQTWTGTDNRRIQIGWMRGGQYPGMPFNQQMSFPCELSLVFRGDRPWLVRNPVPEIESLHQETFTVREREVRPGENPLSEVSGDLFDITMKVQPREAEGFSLTVYGNDIAWAKDAVTVLGRTASLPPLEGTVELRILVDRTSLEVFGNGGEVVLSSCFIPQTATTDLRLSAIGSPVVVENLSVHRLKSAWV